MKNQFEMNLMSTIQNLGLECNQSYININEVKHFLIKRFNFLTDDIEHKDYFNLGRIG